MLFIFYIVCTYISSEIASNRIPSDFWATEDVVSFDSLKISTLNKMILFAPLFHLLNSTSLRCYFLYLLALFLPVIQLLLAFESHFCHSYALDACLYSVVEFRWKYVRFDLIEIKYTCIHITYLFVWCVRLCVYDIPDFVYISFFPLLRKKNIDKMFVAQRHAEKSTSKKETNIKTHA